MWIDGRSADSQRPDHNGQTIPGPQLEQFIVLNQIAADPHFEFMRNRFELIMNGKFLGYVLYLFFYGLLQAPVDVIKTEDGTEQVPGFIGDQLKSDIKY